MCPRQLIENGSCTFNGGRLDSAHSVQGNRPCVRNVTDSVSLLSRFKKRRTASPILDSIFFRSGQKSHRTKISESGLASSAPPSLFRRVVVQIRPEPTFHLCNAHPLAHVIVGHLIAANLAEAEITRFRVRKVESAHARARPHRK